MENYILKHSNGNIFHYTHLLEAIDGFVDNFDVSFSSTLFLERENKEMVLVYYAIHSKEFIFSEHLEYNNNLFKAKVEDRMEGLTTQIS